MSMTPFPNIIFSSVTSIAFKELQNWTDKGLLSRIVVDEAHVIVSDVDYRGDDFETIQKVPTLSSHASSVMPICFLMLKSVQINSCRGKQILYSTTKYMAI